MACVSFTSVRLAPACVIALALVAFHAAHAQTDNAGEPPAAAVKRPGPPAGSRDGRSAITGQTDRNAANRDGDETIQIGTADRRLMRDMAEAHWMEIKTASLAAAISENPGVRDYAEQAIEEHIDGLRKLRNLADAGHVLLPGGVEKEQAAQLHQLALQTGHEFDRMYLDQTAQRGQTVRVFQEAGKNAQIPQLKAYAAQFAPVYEKQFQEVRQLAEKEGATRPGTDAGNAASGTSDAAKPPVNGGKK